MVSFRGQKSLCSSQIGLLQGFHSKFPTSISTPVICGVLPPPPESQVRVFVHFIEGILDLTLVSLRRSQ